MTEEGRIKVLPANGFEGTIAIVEKVGFICSVANDVTWAKVIIAYVPNEKLLEFQSFREFLMTVKIGTAEEAAQTIFETVNGTLGPKAITLLMVAEAETHGKVIIKMSRAEVNYEHKIIETEETAFAVLNHLHLH